MLFFSSDQHYHHLNALKLIPSRPWSTIDEMNQGLLQAHNSVVSEDDVVIFLGDLVMGQKSETVPAIIPFLKGRKYLILGNHDAGFQARDQKFLDKIDIYLRNGIIGVRDGSIDLIEFLTKCGEHELVKSLGDLAIDLCHFPYKGVPDHSDMFEDRYASLKPEPSDKLLLHGHTHRETRRTAYNMIHVGVDAWGFLPVSFDQILELYL